MLTKMSRNDDMFGFDPFDRHAEFTQQDVYAGLNPDNNRDAVSQTPHVGRKSNSVNSEGLDMIVSFGDFDNVGPGRFERVTQEPQVTLKADNVAAEMQFLRDRYGLSTDIAGVVLEAVAKAQAIDKLIAIVQKSPGAVFLGSLVVEEILSA